MRISEPRYDKDKRRYGIARQMLLLEVRTKLICQWSGLSKYRIQTLFREYREPGENLRRPRGMSPHQPALLVGSLQLERESAAFTTVALNFGILPVTIVPDAAASLPSLARGERLLDAYRLYRDLVPYSEISMEQAFLLITELAQRSVLNLKRCVACVGLMVVDRQGARHDHCAFCREGGRSPATRMAQRI